MSARVNDNIKITQYGQKTMEERTMADKNNILTYAGLERLEDELHDFKVVKRKEVAQKIK